MTHTIRVEADGAICAVYADDLIGVTEAIGDARICRASHVEPAPDGSGWTADLAPMAGPILGPFARRADALAAEVAWLDRWLRR